MYKKGFTLIEILIALGVVSLLLLGVNKLVLSALSTTRSFEARTEFNSLVQSMEFVLKDKSLCGSSFYNQNPDPEKSRALFNPDSEIEPKNILSSVQMNKTPIAKIGQHFSASYISKLALIEIDSSKREIISATQKKYLAQFQLEVTPSGNNPQNKKFTRDFLLWITTKNSAIESCEMSSPATKEVPNVKPAFKLVTRTQTCPVKFYPAPDNSWGCLASCNPDETVSGGGFNKSAANTAGGAYSIPSGNGWLCNLGNITGCSGGYSVPCYSSCYAVCMKIEKQD